MHKKLYYVSLNKMVERRDRLGLSWSNFIATPSLARARFWAKKLKLKHRQIDVREKGKKPYVLEGSWL